MALSLASDLDAGYQDALTHGSDIVAHLPTLHDTVLRYPEAKVLELGVRWGASTSALLAAVAKVDGHLWSVDVNVPLVPGWWMPSGWWSLIVADDLDPDLPLPDSFDVVFIDTLHHMNHTLEELRRYVPRCTGTVLCHDTELEHPDSVPAEDPPFPVARALDTYCAETDRTWVNHSGCYGLGVIEI